MSELDRRTHADLVEMEQQIGWVLADPVGACIAQFVVPVATGEKANPQGTCLLRRAQVPARITAVHRVAVRDRQTFGGSQKSSGSGLA